MELLCLICVMERKMYDQTISSTRPPGMEAPVMQSAVTMCPTEYSPFTLICYKHIGVQQQSVLAVPNGTRLPPPPKGM